jgi:hypothetical protein
MTRTNRSAVTLREELQIVALDEMDDLFEDDFEWPSYVFGDFDDLYDDNAYDIWDDPYDVEYDFPGDYWE